MFTALHKLLVDDLAREVLASLDVDGLLDDGIGSTAEGLSSAVLRADEREDYMDQRGKAAYLAGHSRRVRHRENGRLRWDWSWG